MTFDRLWRLHPQGRGRQRGRDHLRQRDRPRSCRGAPRSSLGEGLTVVSVPAGREGQGLSEPRWGLCDREPRGRKRDGHRRRSSRSTIASGQTKERHGAGTSSGFSSPVDNPNVLNVVNAGQAVPFKWRLVRPDGSPHTTYDIHCLGDGQLAGVHNRLDTRPARGGRRRAPPDSRTSATATTSSTGRAQDLRQLVQGDPPRSGRRRHPRRVLQVPEVTAAGIAGVDFAAREHLEHRHGVAPLAQ